MTPKSKGQSVGLPYRVPEVPDCVASDLNRVEIPEALLAAIEEAFVVNTREDLQDVVLSLANFGLETFLRSRGSLFIKERRTDTESELAAMSADEQYRQEALKITEEFALSDWEAFQHGEMQAP